MEVFYKSQTQLNGIAIDDKGRTFLSYPDWNGKPAFAVGMIRGQSAIPYPSAFVNNMFKSVNAIHIANNSLFVVDSTIVHRIDLSLNRLTQSYPIKNSSRLNDIRVKETTAYITDSGNGKLFKLNLVDGTTSELLSDMMAPGDKITIDGKESEIKVNLDAIEFTPNKDALLLSYPLGGPLWKYHLKDSRLEMIGSLPAHGGILIMDDGHLIYSDPISHRIMHRNLETYAEKIYAEDARLNWPDAMIQVNGEVYVPAAQLTNPEPKAPYLVFKFK